MYVGPTELLGAHELAGGRFDQWRAAQKYGAGTLHDDALIGHRRNIGAPGRARSHHAGELGDAARRESSLIEENAAEVLAVGKHLVLQWQIRAAGIHQVDARQAVLTGNLLRPQMLLDRDRIVGAALHGRIVGNDHAFAPAHAPDAGHDTRAGNLIPIHAMGRQRAELQPRRARIEQQIDTLARGKLAFLVLPQHALFAAASLGISVTTTHFCESVR